MELINKCQIYTILIIILCINKSYSNNTIFFKETQYCYDNNLGWKFYCDESVDTENIKEEQEEDKDNKTYSEKLLELQKNIEEIKAKAVLEPTEKNVKEYMFLQQKIVNQASLFSNIWRRIIWKTPELDYTQKRPVSSFGKNVWETDRERNVINSIKNINNRYGLFFIYSTSCSFCQKYSEILYNLKTQYNISIKGISIDGKYLPLWENNSFINKGQLEQLGINYNTVPVTILYDNLTKSVITVGYGLMTQDELMQRIYIITQISIGDDY